MDATEVIDRYCESWSDPDPARRAALLDQVWAAGATYTDPSVHAARAVELLAHIARVHARRPNSRVLRTTALDLHHGIARFAWKAVDATGATLIGGIDLAFLSVDGSKIERILGFFGRLKPMPAEVFERACPVLQVTDVERSVRWYEDVLGFVGDPLPTAPPHAFAMLRSDGAEVMLQQARARGTRPPGAPDPELLWSVYLRVSSAAILPVAAAVAKKTPLLRGPELMSYDMVEFEVGDPDGHRVCVGGEPPPGADVKKRAE
jgi:catechol 2,3-dioxygenase-like lactoylglutathione lyase family enzyme